MMVLADPPIITKSVLGANAAALLDFVYEHLQANFSKQKLTYCRVPQQLSVCPQTVRETMEAVMQSRFLLYLHYV